MRYHKAFLIAYYLYMYLAEILLRRTRINMIREASFSIFPPLNEIVFLCAKFVIQSTPLDKPLSSWFIKCIPQLSAIKSLNPFLTHFLIIYTHLGKHKKDERYLFIWSLRMIIYSIEILNLYPFVWNGKIINYLGETGPPPTKYT